MKTKSIFSLKVLVLIVFLSSLIVNVSCLKETRTKSEEYVTTCKNYDCHIAFSKKIKQKPAMTNDYLDYPRVMEKAGRDISSFDISENEICFDCHNKSIAAELGSEANSSFRNGDSNLHFKHFSSSGFKVKSCNVCHDIHAGSQPRFITSFSLDGAGGFPNKANLRFRITETGGRCETACHKSMSYNRVHPVESK